MPRLYEESADSPDGLSKAELEEAMALQQAGKFRRGAMHFEDYNYELYNKYVLIDPAKQEYCEDPSDAGDPDSPAKEKMLGFSAPPTGEGMGGTGEEQAAKKPPITENILE